MDLYPVDSVIQQLGPGIYPWLIYLPKIISQGWLIKSIIDFTNQRKEGWGIKLTGATPVTIPEPSMEHISAPLPFLFVKWWIESTNQPQYLQPPPPPPTLPLSLYVSESQIWSSLSFETGVSQSRIYHSIPLKWKWRGIYWLLVQGTHMLAKL